MPTLRQLAAARSSRGADPPLPPDRRDRVAAPRPTLRDKFILRLIAVDKTFRFLLFSALAVGVFLIAANETGVRDLYRLLADFRGDSGESFPSTGSCTRSTGC